MKAKIIPEGLLSALRYDPVTGHLFWTSGRRRGKIAGCLCPNGYVAVGYLGKHYRAHRIIWVMVNGETSNGYDVDHKNTVKNDNRWDNLRLGTYSQNLANQKIGCRNKSGYKGVSWDSSRNMWTAGISINGKRKGLGRFIDPHQAHLAYVNASIAAFGEFARAA